MPVTATQIFDFLERQQTWTIEKHEITCRPFSILRKAIRTVVLRLSETDDAEDTAYALRARLAELLTVPIPFDRTRLSWVEEAFGAPDLVERRRGRDIRESYELARDSAREMAEIENPLRTRLRETFKTFEGERTNFRIYCHRKAREHFKSIAEGSVELVSDRFFLHSARDYSEVEPFDALIKVGPLRSKGWGAAPDALVTAPRFGRLIHLVWSGCADEDDFGYDPAFFSGVARPSLSGAARTDSSVFSTFARWTRRLFAVGIEVNDTDRDIDDLRVFHELSRSGDLRKAVCIQIDENRGILLPPESRVPSYDSMVLGEDAIDFRAPIETLEQGMFVISSDLDEPNARGLKVVEGHYSKIWKSRLWDELQRDPTGLVRRLRDGGISLRHLRFGVMYWCKPNSTVIHAPKTEEHFRILISVLGIDNESAAERARPHEWWRYAWLEITRARGEAIQSGLQEHEILNQQLVDTLRRQLPGVRERAKATDAFVIELPEGQSLEGAVQFHKVLALEEGFLAPSVAMKVACRLDDIEQWRV